jgi:hypothetical protein
MDELSLRLDDNEELNALTLTTLLNLSPSQLIQLEQDVQELKKQKTPTAFGMPTMLHQSTRKSGSKKRQSQDADEVFYERPRPTGGQYMNLPASTPQVEFAEGIEWLVFTYSTKGHIQEYHIRADIEILGIDEIPDDFKAENCVYPRALVPREAYVGNRYDYEVAVNEIAWKLCWRNPEVLCGKRGLIQRAVDSYRNRTPENRSRRVMRQEKLHTNAPYAKRPQGVPGMPMPFIRVPGPKTLTLQYADREGELTKIKIRVDIEGVDLAQVDDDFRANNAIFPQALVGGPDYTPERWEYETICNELGWKLAWLNSAKLAGKPALLAKAVEAYQSRVEAAERARQAVLYHHQQALGHAGYDPSMFYEQGPDDKGGEGFSHMVAQAMQQAMAHGLPMEAGEEHHYHPDDPNAVFHYQHVDFGDHHIIHHQPEGEDHLQHHREHEEADKPSGGEEFKTVSTAELIRSKH